MRNHHHDRKRFRADEAISHQKRFADLDPGKMGLELPDWLDDSHTISRPTEQQQHDDATAAATQPQLDAVLEGMKTVCICKGIKKRIFWKAMAAGARTKDEINQATGSGSGSCQGRRCGPRILEMLRNERHDGTTEE